MTTLSFRPPASIGAGFLAIVLLILMVESPRLIAMASKPPVANEIVSAEAAWALRSEATDRDPSVPAASGVRFPAGDDTESAVATF